MSIRIGVTESEERKIKKMVADGAEWGEIVPTLTDCDLDYVKENIFKPLKAAADAAAVAKDIGDDKPPKK